MLVHGFTQTRRSWSLVADALFGAGFEVVAVDAPGHGGSRNSRVDLWGAAQELIEAGGPATYVGYSMGARIALHAALAAPSTVKRLVLLSAAAGIEQASERSERRTSDEELARALERDGLEAFLGRWMNNPLFATLTPEAAAISDRLDNSVDGLASSLRLCGTGSQDPPLWDRLGELTMPTLVVAGALDVKFAALARRLAAGVGPAASLRLIADAGHAAHLEKPAEFVAVVLQFLFGNPSP